MTELHPIAGRAHYLPGVNNLGIIVTGDGGAIAVDTGLDKDTGRAIRKALDAAKLRLDAIISTHHHADHIGGNDALLRSYPAALVYATPLEAALIAHPLLEPVYLSMGAAPVAALQNKWLMAKGAPVHRLIAGQQLEVAGVTLEVVPLAGHSLGQVGVALDGVCYAADGFFGPATLQKHGIPYAQDVAGQLAALRQLAGRDEQFFLPGHGELYRREQLAAVLDANLAAVERASQAVLAALAEPGDLHAVGRLVRGALGLTLSAVPQYAIFLSAVSAHLGALAAQGLAHLTADEDGMCWHAGAPA